MCPPLLTAQSGQVVTEAFFEYAAGPINVNESTRSVAAGMAPFAGGRSFSLMKTAVRCKYACGAARSAALLIRSS